MDSTSMKIAMLSIHSCPIGELGTKDTGGMSVYIRELARELGKKGHSIDIYTRYHGLKHDRIIDLYENVRLMHVTAGDCDDMHKLAVYPYIKDFADVMDDFKRTEGIRYDLIHSHYWLSGLVGNFLSKWWNIPHTIMFHTLGAIKNTLNIGEPEPECRICSEKALAHTCGKIIAPTIKEKQEIIKFCEAEPKNVSVIPCGVNQELFAPVDRREARNSLGIGMAENVILYVGRVEPLKGIDRLIKTTAWLKKRIGIKLLIVGGDDPDHPQMKRASALARELEIGDYVKFAGRVDQKDLPLYYSAADALVVASLYESFGLVAMEAMSCGTPVVSTEVGGMRTIVRQGETGCLVSDDSVAGMGSAIFDVLYHRGIYPLRSQAIRNSISRFSWENIAASMIEGYADLIADYLRNVRNGESKQGLLADQGANGQFTGLFQTTAGYNGV